MRSKPVEKKALSRQGGKGRIRADRQRPKVPGARVRWRLRGTGMVRLVIITVILANLFLLADGVVRLVKKNRAAEALSDRIAEERKRLQNRKKVRDYMSSPEYVRDAARNLGYVDEGDRVEAVAEPIGPSSASPVPRRKRVPPIPY